MKTGKFTFIILATVAISFTCCEKDNTDPSGKNPFSNENNWNGFIIDGNEYNTPNAVIEIWGENLDSLSADYDISFTDGTFDYVSRQITGDEIMLYLDANSPKLDDFSPGTYFIENTTERKPGNIVEAYIQVTNSSSIIRYPILSGKVEVEEEDGHYFIEYELESVVNSQTTTVKGSYSGNYTVIDQTSLK
jgi:hypothetical protein